LAHFLVATNLLWRQISCGDKLAHFLVATNFNLFTELTCGDKLLIYFSYYSSTTPTTHRLHRLLIYIFFWNLYQGLVEIYSFIFT
jgi:hypothetical protein